MLSDDIIAKIGLDNRPFRKTLRSTSASVGAFSKEVNQKFLGYGKGLITAFGIRAVILGLRDIIQSAREAKEAGEEFGKGGWMSPQTISVLTTVDDTFASIKKNVKEFTGFLLGGIGKFARFLGAFSVTGSFDEANEIIKSMADEDKKSLESAQRKKQLEEELKKQQKAQEESKRKQAASDKEREASLKRQAELMKQLSDAERGLSEAKGSLASARQARGKFTLQELASSPMRFSGRLGLEQNTARQVVGMEARAEALRQRGFADPALQLLSRAEQLRGSLSNVVDSDRFPFRSIEEGIWRSEEHLADVARAAQETGVKIIPSNRK